ncbi:DNA polymerase III subunit delta' [Candidatus Chlamydia sanziniae]|uniref:DNA polymerase III delta prime subunit n=1 Tax=Candidatus Chlamydia sanziniae TaxID=1806891 RepID=A0A1A9HWE4_9CHLA|nr:DNA polymerase III subunit delta' [Candidatus Chlamydia sanziniae]ANH79017.1 DNA polymerase III delta prime subunit [Candidatus Chlamydia sanziniae]
MQVEIAYQRWSTLLKKITNGKIPSGIMLYGPSLTSLRGKAYDLASEILLSQSPRAQHKISQRIHPDIHEFFPISKGKLHSIDLPREIKKQIWIQPFESCYKVYIIHEVDRMTLPAISAFLKVFEEPPIHAVITLTTTKPQRLPATILSRSFAIFIEGKESSILDQQEIDYVLRYAQGLIPITEVAQIVKQTPEFDKQALREKVKTLLQMLLALYRDRYMLDLKCKAPFLVYPKYVNTILQLPLLPLKTILAVIENAYQALDNASSGGAILEWVALQLLSLKNQVVERKIVNYNAADLSKRELESTLFL